MKKPKRIYSFLSPFLSCRTERKLQELALEGCSLTSMQNDMFLYTLFFDETMPQSCRYFVFQMDDLGKAHVQPIDPREAALIELAPLCEEIFECNGFAFIGKVKPDTPETVLQALVAKRMKHTARYHMECLVVWIILPVATQIVNLLSNTPWRRGSVLVGSVLIGAICLYHLVAASTSYFEGKKATQKCRK